VIAVAFVPAMHEISRFPLASLEGAARWCAPYPPAPTRKDPPKPGKELVMRWPWQSSESRTTQFWAWFEQNEDRLFTSIGAESQAFRELTRELRRVSPGLVAEVGHIESRRRELTFSADGMAELFPVVNELVQSAPALDRWCFVALRPRRGARTIEMGSLRITPEDVRVSCARDGQRVGLQIYMRGYHDTPSQLYEQAAFVLLDSAVGEHDVETKVGFVEIFPLGETPGTISLDELGDVIDSMLDEVEDLRQAA
jgi:hypothetical protein